MFISVATAKELVESSMEEVDYSFRQSPIVESMPNGWGWFLWSMGLLMGIVIELGTNTFDLWPCLGQPSVVAESVYFTYFYIRQYFEDGFETTNITYVATYIAKLIEAILSGPCWNIEIRDRLETEEEIETV